MGGIAVGCTPAVTPHPRSVASIEALSKTVDSSDAPRAIESMAPSNMWGLHLELMKTFVGVLCIVCALTACSSGQKESVAPQSGSTPAAAPGQVLQKANAPIGELTGGGEHCFYTGVEAVAGQLRAKARVDQENREAQEKFDATGEKMPYGSPFTVTDVTPNGTCYEIQPRPLS